MHSLSLLLMRRDHYFPNTEPLPANEMRIISLGTGRPFVRRAQANCSWLIELGNDDKFIMDFGSGSQAKFTALEIPHQNITAYFATHLHADHVGDFAQVCWLADQQLIPKSHPGVH
jgi:ribonuclease Z